ncbi:YHS domain-containing (seleno)protein [Pseudoroseicyclus tamaricis]|uniref:YHS domain protein n=1 Tax=Pseudoroseicyclus tamaricis TaxID=2705421 RepID=A0A6B2JUE9_9RHOB|nr:YHS domain-containing (seleno)protein [Pseudoroseicyclus tamaricis]NDV01938.1 YHS domain protein [Pseudoroseicyclus tamaricis]
MPTRRHLLHSLALSPLALAAARPALAGTAEIYAPGGIAIGGTDPVSYFTDGGPRSGSPRAALMWRGAVWHFASDASRAAFEMNPARYAPRYGGYCAFALAKGALAPTVPDAFTIHEGRLYLNYSLDIRARWRTDAEGNIAAANQHWPTILG